MDRRAFLATAGVPLSVAVAGCLEGGLADDDYDVGMAHDEFLPQRYEVTVGETVVWGNNGSRGHTVTAYAAALPDGADFFASGGYDDPEVARADWHERGGGNVPPGETFAHTFETPGEHGYFCVPHEAAGMTGVVVVTE